MKEELFAIEEFEYNQFMSVYKFGTVYKGMRLGQAFHTHFKLDKSTAHKELYDKLYELDNEQAKAFIKSHFLMT